MAAAPAVSYSDTLLGAMFLGPVRVPLDFDQTYPSTIYIDVNPETDNATANLKAYMFLTATVCPKDGTVYEPTSDMIFPIPNPWSFQDTARIGMDDGTGVTFQGGVIDPTAMIGLRLQRRPADANDNYPLPLDCLATATWVYHRRRQWNGIVG